MHITVMTHFHVHRKLTAPLLSCAGSYKPRPLPAPPSCPQLKWALPHPLNSSSPGNIFHPKNPLSASDGGRDPIDPVAAGYYDDGSNCSNNVLVFGGLAVGVAVLWLVCRRRRRVSGRRGTILSKLQMLYQSHSMTL